jgi:dTDP-4-dehydrorhamnose reductase
VSGEGRVLVPGGFGTLGTALSAEAARRGVAAEPLGRDDLDLADPRAIRGGIASRSPAAVINAAAFSDVDGAEDPAREAEVLAVNRDAPGEIAAACRELGVPLLHVSTDYVFDGTADRPYREDDPAGPLQMYGRSKLEGERAVLEACPEALIARTSTLFGRSAEDRPSFVSAVLRYARRDGRVRLVQPPVSSPTYAVDLAAALLDLLVCRARGIVHVVNEGEASRYELGRAAIEAAGLADRVEIAEREVPPGGTPRPLYSVLDTSRLHELLGRGMRPWREALHDFVASGDA